jgi:hypothetical protein
LSVGRESPLTRSGERPALPAALDGRVRLPALDIVRGGAIVLMLITHSAELLASPRFPWHQVAVLGNLTCYTAFLFVMGTACAVAYLQQDRLDEATRGRLLRRTARILLAYYGAGLVLTIALNTGVGFQAIFTAGLRILTLRTQVAFTEFLLPLALYGLSIWPLWRTYRWILVHPARPLLVGGAAYTVGLLAFRLLGPFSAVSWAPLLIGGGNSFPLLQYLPVFLLGLWVGKEFVVNERERLSRRLLWAGCILLILAFPFAASPALGSIAAFDQRFPPSVGFLVLGSGAVLIALTGAFHLPDQSAALAVVGASLTWLGRRPLTLLLCHYVVLIVCILIFRALDLHPLGAMHFIPLALVVLVASISATAAADQFVRVDSRQRGFGPASGAPAAWSRILPVFWRRGKVTP